MLIGAGQEKRSLALQAVKTGQGIAQKGRRGRADMRNSVDVVNRGGDVKSRVMSQSSDRQ